MAKVLPNFREGVQYIGRADISNLCSVLNVLGAVRWQLNDKVLEVMEHMWSVGGGVADIPKRFNEKNITPEMIKEAPFREKLKLLKQHQHNNEDNSLRCEWLLRLAIAQGYRQCSSIYFPHNYDFRGRVYPIAPHLNHMGPDINRGIL